MGQRKEPAAKGSTATLVARVVWLAENAERFEFDVTPGPAGQWYFADWLSDRAVRMMSSSARGDHMDSICYAWAEHLPCSLPTPERDPSDVDKRMFLFAWEEIDGRIWQRGLLKTYLSQIWNRLANQKGGYTKSKNIHGLCQLEVCRDVLTTSPPYAQQVVSRCSADGDQVLTYPSSTSPSPSTSTSGFTQEKEEDSAPAEGSPSSSQDEFDAICNALHDSPRSDADFEAWQAMPDRPSLAFVIDWIEDLHNRDALAWRGIYFAKMIRDRQWLGLRWVSREIWRCRCGEDWDDDIEACSSCHDQRPPTPSDPEGGSRPCWVSSTNWECTCGTGWPADFEKCRNPGCRDLRPSRPEVAGSSPAPATSDEIVKSKPKSKPADHRRELEEWLVVLDAKMEGFRDEWYSWMAVIDGTPKRKNPWAKVLEVRRFKGFSDTHNTAHVLSMLETAGRRKWGSIKLDWWESDKGGGNGTDGRRKLRPFADAGRQPEDEQVALDEELTVVYGPP